MITTLLLLLTGCADRQDNSWQPDEPFEAIRFVGSGRDITFYTVAPGEPATISGAAAEISGGVLSLDARCDTPCAEESVSVGVRADIDVSGSLRDGDLLLSGLGGVLEVSVTDGDIEADALASPWATLATVRGDIDARWERTPADAQLTADGGAILAQVPAGAYALDILDADVDGITEDPDASAFIYARASAGPVQLSGR